MKRLSIFLLLLTSIWGYKAQAQPENWDTYMAKVGEHPASVLVNMALIDMAPNKDYPFVVVTGPQYHPTTKNRLPNAEEIDQMETVLDATSDFLTGVTPKVLAGTYTCNGDRLNYYYVKDTVNIRNALARMYTRNFKGSHYVLRMKRDAEWSTYRTFLYPSEDIQNWMDNAKILTPLLQNGDSVNKRKSLDFKACFMTDTARAKFIDALPKLGYTHKLSNTIHNKDIPYCVTFTKTLPLNIDTLQKPTMELRHEITTRNGVYGGWMLSK